MLPDSLGGHGGILRRAVPLMWMMTRAAVALVIAASACSSADSSPLQSAGDLGKTGLEGTARRGPIQPVCREGESCDAPLQAGFTLRQDGRVVVHFASDSTGRFLVYSAPGTYSVVPDEPIGIGTQTPEVTVGADSLTHVDLLFDTGIR
jgi:hypothetical protein